MLSGGRLKENEVDRLVGEAPQAGRATFADGERYEGDMTGILDGGRLVVSSRYAGRRPPAALTTAVLALGLLLASSSSDEVELDETRPPGRRRLGEGLVPKCSWRRTGGPPTSDRGLLGEAAASEWSDDDEVEVERKDMVRWCKAADDRRWCNLLGGGPGWTHVDDGA